MSRVQGPNVIDKTIRERLAKKSLYIFGAKHKWRQLAGQLNLSVEEVEKQMDAMIHYAEEAIKNEQNRGYETRSGETTSIPTTVGSDE